MTTSACTHVGTDLGGDDAMWFDRPAVGYVGYIPRQSEECWVHGNDMFESYGFTLNEAWPLGERVPSRVSPY